MFRHFSKVSLLIFCGWLLVGPLALLQLGAWGWMLASYSQKSSFEQAIIETFGDERPCDVCRVIDSVEESGNELPMAQGGQKDIKLMLGLGRAIKAEAPQQQSEPVAAFVCEPENALSLVPTPPPRAA